MIRVAAVQYCGTADVAGNLAIITALVAEAHGAGANWVCLPECANVMGADADTLEAHAEPADDSASVRYLGDLARQYQLTLFAGSLLLRGAGIGTGIGKLVNRSFVFDANGQQIAHYDKIHMFDADVGDGTRYAESEQFTAGTRAVIARLDEVSVGLTVCYDIRFPALYRQLAQNGAAVLMIPAAFTKRSGTAHWHVLARARAIETGSFVIAATQAGKHADGRQTYGHALIISPWGEVLADGGSNSGPDSEPHIIYADLDLSLVDKARRSITAWQHNPPFHLA